MAFEHPHQSTMEPYLDFNRQYERSLIEHIDHSSFGSRNSNPSALERFLLEPNSPFFPPAAPSSDHQMDTLPCPIQQRRSSPTLSTLDASYVSSGWSDRQLTPISPRLNNSPYSPDCSYNDGLAYAYGFQPLDAHDSFLGSNCVAMPDIQHLADDIPESMAFDDGYIQYHYPAQEGYHPLEPEEESTPDTSISPASPGYLPESETSTQGTTSPTIRHRRTQPPRPAQTSSYSGGRSRVSKRPSAGRRSSSYLSTDDGDDHISSSNPSGGIRAFQCPLAVYGCPSSFGSKNEWKRHVNTQHLRLSFWRCDQCGSAQKPNDFNRKDLFIQHVRRMHPLRSEGNVKKKSGQAARSSTKGDSAEEQELQEAARRCHKALRPPPEHSGCLFCTDEFHGRGTWDERMEHIGRHMENTKKETGGSSIDIADWRSDEYVHDYLVVENIVMLQGKRWVLATA